MREVAGRDRVSVTTFSHVIKISRPVNPQTRDRVEETMQALGFLGNVPARNLRRRVTHIMRSTKWVQGPQSFLWKALLIKI